MTTDTQKRAAALAAISDDERAARDDLAQFALLTDDLRLTYTERFWARVCLSLSEQASIAAERLRWRTADEHVMRFYAWDSGPANKTHLQVREEMLRDADRYRHLSLWLIACVHDAHAWVQAEIARMQERDSS